MVCEREFSSFFLLFHFISICGVIYITKILGLSCDANKFVLFTISSFSYQTGIL